MPPANATYYYRVRAYNTSGASNSSNTITINLITDVENILGTRAEYKLYQNYPNPFNPAAFFPGGVYFYRLTAGNFSSVKKFVLLK